MLVLSSLFPLLVSLACVMSFSVDTSAKSNPTETSYPTERAGTLNATFVGQDGGNYAGKLCSSGTENDNVHIHLSGLRKDHEPAAFRVDDYAEGGVWATPCDPVSNWFLYVKTVGHGEADIYFKPFRDAPEGTEYKITVSYNDGVTQEVIVKGSHITP